MTCNYWWITDPYGKLPKRIAQKRFLKQITSSTAVWGFLKYYHPAVTSGRRQWDYDLFRILPEILKARDHKSANAAIAHWIETLGPVDPCNPCGKLDQTELEFGPDLD